MEKVWRRFGCGDATVRKGSCLHSGCIFGEPLGGAEGAIVFCFVWGGGGGISCCRCAVLLNGAGLLLISALHFLGGITVTL